MSTPLADPVTVSEVPGTPYLAVDVLPDDAADTFAVDVSEVDGPDLIGWGDDNADDWLNIVCDVTRVSLHRGAVRLQGPLTRAEAGLATVELLDTERRFDPTVSADAIHKGTPVRVRAWGSDVNGELWDAVLFTGELDQPQVQYRKSGPPLVTFTAVDIIGPLAAWESEGRPEPGIGAGDDLRERVTRTLAECGIGTVSPDSDTGYAATLAPTVLARPWAEINAATEAELGRVWVDASNRLVIRGRDSELTGPVRGTLSDVHGEAPLGVHCCITDDGAVIVHGPEQIANRALASRRVPRDPAVSDPPEAVLARVDDAHSQARYGVVTINGAGLEVQTDAQAADWAQVVVTEGSQPQLRVETVTPAPSPLDLDSALAAWPAVLATDIGDRWLFRFRPEVGPQVSRALGVLGISLDLSPQDWAVTWTTTDAPEPSAVNPSGWFTVGLSELGGDDVLALFPGAPPGTVFGDVDGGAATQGPVTQILEGGSAAGEQNERPTDGGPAAW